MAVSMALAKFPFDGEYMARQIRKWGEEYLLNGKLAPHRQGAHAKIAPMIENEAFASKCQTWLKDCKPEKRGPLALKKFIEESVFPTLPKPEKAPISDTSRPPKPERSPSARPPAASTSRNGGITSLPTRRMYTWMGMSEPMWWRRGWGGCRACSSWRRG